ncbi:MAG: hypothetical protein ACKV2T_17910 [Kofleriaceae bacterium]
MNRIAAALIALALLGAIAIGVGVFVGESHAELENSVFTSRANRLRMVVPRGWRATDQPSYPGLLLWMLRSQPPGQMVLTAEAFTREQYCSWPIACRTSPESLSSKYACALRTKLQRQRMQVGPVQAGPKDNEAAGLPSVWFEYDDGKRFLRQAVAVGGDRAVTLVLSTQTNEARAAHVRPFEQALRTLRPLTTDEASTIEPDAAIVQTPTDGAVLDATTIDAGFESAPAPKINPVGPCPS